MADKGRKDGARATTVTASSATSSSTASAVQPDFTALVADLRMLRSAGLLKLRVLRLPALGGAARVVGDGDDPTSIETLLRRAVERLDGGELGDAAGLLFGLVAGYRGRSPTELRRHAAEAAYGMKAETFRKLREPQVIEQVAESILMLCRDGALRQAHEQMAQRHPADSRLAVQWVERFEAYYRIWTPVYALAADLAAYRCILNEIDRPYDKIDAPGPSRNWMTPNDTDPYSQEYQAEGYVRFAIFRFAQVLWELKQFQLRNGGFWLFSDPDIEVAARDALYELQLHSPNNERDDSWMRATFKQADGELHTFQHLLSATTIGSATHQEWQEWAARCQCTWDADRTADERGIYFATAATDPGISPECPVHAMIAAACSYCEIVDGDWMHIADWYKIAGSLCHVRTRREELG